MMEAMSDWHRDEYEMRQELSEKNCERCGERVMRRDLPRHMFAAGPGPLMELAIVCPDCRRKSRENSEE